LAHEKAAVFIDGGYFAKVLKDYFGEARIDYLRLSETLCSGYERFRTYYYNCMPYQSDPPTDEEKARYQNMQRFVVSLQRMPRFVVRLGRLRKTKDGFEQKGVDVQLAIDLVELSLTASIQKAIIIAGDADYVPPVKKARDSHALVHLYYYPGTVSMELRDNCDERTEITQRLIDQVRMP